MPVEKPIAKEISSLFRSATVSCMDEGYEPALGEIHFGLVASGVTKKEGGNIEMYSLEDRLLMEKARPVILRGLRWVADMMGIVGNLKVTSHQSCGGAGAQGIGEDNVADLTKIQSVVGDKRIVFANHIPYKEKAEEVPDDSDITDNQVYARMTRKPEDHHHTADRIEITIGGGIDHTEKIDEQHKNSFIISAEWIPYALQNGLTKEDITRILKLQMGIAIKIMRRDLPVAIFDAGRLPAHIVEENRKIVVDILQSLTSSN